MRWTRSGRYRLVVLALETLRRALRFVPHRWALALGRGLGLVGWLILGPSRRLAQQQLLAAGVARSEEAAARVTRRVFEHIGMNLVEALSATHWTPEDYHRLVRVEGQRPDTCRTGDRGLIFAAGHVGNWEIIVHATSVLFGMPMRCIMTPQRNPHFNAWIVRMRERFGSSMVSSESSAISMVRFLRRGGILGVLMDQNSTRTRGVFVNFFGRPARTPVGPGMLAVMAGVPVVPACIRRDPERPDRHIVEYGAPFYPNANADPEAEALRLTQEVTTFLEEKIARWPEQWVWIHDRWRRRPDDAISADDARGQAVVSPKGLR